VRITAPEPDARAALDTVDLFDPGRYQASCQHVVWQTLRAASPVWWQRAANGCGFWSLTRHADCDEVLRHSQVFSSVDGTILASVGVGDAAGGLTITLMDPPEHTKIRRSAMRLLGSSGVRARLERVRSRVERAVGPLPAGGEHDFALLARRLPMAMFGDLMGVPEQLWDPIAYWASASIAPEDPEFRRGASVDDTMRDAHHQLFELFTEALRHSRRHPGDDLLTILSTLRIDGRRMADPGPGRRGRALDVTDPPPHPPRRARHRHRR